MFRRLYRQNNMKCEECQINDLTELEQKNLTLFVGDIYRELIKSNFYEFYFI